MPKYKLYRYTYAIHKQYLYTGMLLLYRYDPRAVKPNAVDISYHHPYKSPSKRLQRFIMSQVPVLAKYIASAVGI
jgi:hypothetical protein